MKVGFTGTRSGMTVGQQETFSRLVSESSEVTHFHHGDCVGADDEAANVVHEIRQDMWPDGQNIMIVAHPPEDSKLRAFNPHADETRDPKPYHARNRDIVDATDLLIATPFEMEQQSRGGTWYTVGYARKKSKRVVIIYPDGTVEDSGA